MTVLGSEPVPPGEIHLAGIGKRYTKYEDTPTLAYGLLHAWGRSRRSKLWAVRDVDLDILPGEAVGIIGKNGSGKSTLLQMLCGVTRPSTGVLRVGGRIAPLISVGVGFHPELTGRENIYINGTILGLSRSQVAKRLDEIVAFSEIEDFIDTPVKFYSSGMFVRLGFSVAAHVDPDVLLIDEVLAVGDLGFQLKCYKHMESLRNAGTTIVVVSHNMAAVERHCQRGILMQHGEKTFDGDVREAVAGYHAVLANDLDSGHREDGLPHEQGVLEVRSVYLCDVNGQPALHFSSSETMTLKIHVQAQAAVNAPFLLLSLTTSDGICIYREHNMFTPYPPLAAGQGAVLEALIQPLVSTGSYTLEYTIGRGNPTTREAWLLGDSVATLAPPARIPIYIEGRPGAKGLADLPTRFRSDS